MKPTAFRVTNFRSIVDSDWIPFSPDGVTIFVGQNESGKTSLIEALHCAIGDTSITGDDFQTEAPLPEVFIRAKVDFSEVKSNLEKRLASAEEIDIVRRYFDTCQNSVVLRLYWKLAKVGGGKEYTLHVNFDAPELADNLLQLKADSQATSEPTTPPVVEPAAPPTPATPPASFQPLNIPDLAILLYKMVPRAVLFSAESGLLPNQVDIDEDSEPTGDGARAALNFLDVADISLPDLLTRDTRARETSLNKANAKVSAEFNSFWSQVIGKTGRLALKCDINHYSAAEGAKAGTPHLVFWISDGNTQLYPKQRSLGVRWFVSFFLQLRASEKSGKRCIFLLDEPGANLHSKAQADVLKLINKLGKDTSVVYTTHSPHMIEYAKLFRVHAVQRDGEQEDSPTVVVDAHRLGTASTDTLSPVLSAMGTDLSHQQVIKKTNNVLLEEMSGFYYLTAFWKLTGTSEIAHFIAATGVNKIEALANMFRGWGLEFIVAVDDDSQGRAVYKNLKKELFGDDVELANKKLLKLPNCQGIEDAFSTYDFKRYVVTDDAVDVQQSNSEYLKTAGRSKPVMAFQFMLAVEQGTITWASLEEESQNQITAIVDAIKLRLSPVTN